MANNAKHPVGTPVGLSNSSIFGTDGVRGKAGSQLTPSLALQLGYLVGKMINEEGPVLIGQDSRTSGAMITSALSAGLTSAGKDVWQIGICPTPTVSFLIKETSAAGGFMVSASHNPPEDNGIKVFGANGAKITESEQKSIEKNLAKQGDNIFTRDGFSGFGKVYERKDLLIAYKQFLLDSVNRESMSDFKIVLDLCWGSATSCGADIFQELGANITVLNGQPNGNLINVGCGSTNLKSLQKAILDQEADMGFAFDGDSDRMLAVDSQGRVVDGDHILYLWGQSLYEKNKLPEKKLVATVMSNLGFQRDWEANGGILKRTKVGDQNVYESMVANKANLGGEQSGHILSAEHGFSGDGLLTALQLGKICQEKSLKLADLLETSFTPFPQRLINVPLAKKIGSNNWNKCKPIADAVIEAESELGDQGRVLLRASGTEPLLRVMVEAKDSKTVDLWSSHLADIVEEHLDAA